MIPSLPETATPAERAVLYTYFTGIHSPTEIAKLIRPRSKPEVYRILKKYSTLLPSLRLGSPAYRFIGKGLVYNS